MSLDPRSDSRGLPLLDLSGKALDGGDQVSGLPGVTDGLVDKPANVRDEVGREVFSIFQGAVHCLEFAVNPTVTKDGGEPEVSEMVGLKIDGDKVDAVAEGPRGSDGRTGLSLLGEADIDIRHIAVHFSSLIR